MECSGVIVSCPFVQICEQKLGFICVTDIAQSGLLLTLQLPLQMSGICCSLPRTRLLLALYVLANTLLCLVVTAFPRLVKLCSCLSNYSESQVFGKNKLCTSGCRLCEVLLGSNWLICLKMSEEICVV